MAYVSRIPVTFHKQWGRYNAGETAGFNAPLARNLVSSKVAYVQRPPLTQEALIESPEPVNAEAPANALAGEGGASDAAPDEDEGNQLDALPKRRGRRG